MFLLMNVRSVMKVISYKMGHVFKVVEMNAKIFLELLNPYIHIHKHQHFLFIIIINMVMGV